MIKSSKRETKWKLSEKTKKKSLDINKSEVRALFPFKYENKTALFI